jgi:hypothetical protein
LKISLNITLPALIATLKFQQVPTVTVLSYFKSSYVYHINKQNVYIGQREGQKTNKYYYNLSGIEIYQRDVLCMFDDVANSIL